MWPLSCILLTVTDDLFGLSNFVLVKCLRILAVKRRQPIWLKTESNQSICMYHVHSLDLSMFKELWENQQMTQPLSMKNWILEGDSEAKRY